MGLVGPGNTAYYGRSANGGSYAAGAFAVFFTRASLNPDYKLLKKHRWHFLSVIIDLFPYLTAIFFIIGVLSGLLRNNAFDVGLFIDNYNVYSDIPRWLSLSIYLVVSIRYLSAFKQTAAARPMAGQLKWMRQLTTAFIIFQTIWLLYLIPYVMPAYGNKLLDAVNWYPIYIPLSILIYWLGIKGYLMMQAQLPTVKKANTILADAGSAKIMAILKQAMEHDNLYLNPALNLNLLAQHTGIAQKIISAALNQHPQTGFNDFVNGYRVNEFKQKVCADELKHLTIAGIAAGCGFNSQATFQRIFRQFTGMSPSEFKARTADDSAKQYSNPDLSTA